jgi:hypothetical protein
MKMWEFWKGINSHSLEHELYMNSIFKNEAYMHGCLIKVNVLSLSIVNTQ